MWFLARAASAHVKAVLSGEGADELFGGYPMYREPDALRAVTMLPPAVQHGLRRVADWLPQDRPGRGFLLRATTPLERRFLGNVPIFSEEAKSDLLRGIRGAAARRPSADVVAPYYRGTENIDDAARMQTVSCRTWLPCSILMKADKMSMAHSLEVRVPYLDREVLAVASRLPKRLRIDGMETKVALRAAARELLPTEVADRPKLGFPVPFRSWLSGGLSGGVRELFAAGDRGILDSSALLRLLDGPGGPAKERQVWSVMTYLLWRREQTTAASGGDSRSPCAEERPAI